MVWIATLPDMAFSFTQLAPHPKNIDRHLKDIAATSERAAGFWAKAHGWAPHEAADLLSKARLDWLASFSRTLRTRVKEVEAHPDEPAVIIIAWAHLRTLVECNLKLFLTVFLMDYLKDPHAPVCKKGNPIPPQALKLESIRQFLVKRELLIPHQNFIQEVQARGNAIHAFADKPIGTAEEYLEQIPHYARFRADIDSSLPNPYWPDF